MKRINYFFFVVATLTLTIACKNINFKKTKSGLTYKIFPSKGKDSTLKTGNVAKFNYTFKYNDSMMERMNSYGKMPGFIEMQPLMGLTHDFQEILPSMKKGDSAVVVMLYDSVVNNPMRQSRLFPMHAKKGDRLTMTLKIVDVFENMTAARPDFDAEYKKDMPRQEKEREAEMARMKKEMDEMQAKADEELVKSGEVAKEFKEIEAYLAAKNISAQKMGKGTYVYVKEKGTGTPVTNEKFLEVKYAGRVLRTDSLFESGAYPFQIGKDPVIRGWQEGLLAFNQGGKGTLFIPGFLAYGNNPNPQSGFKPFEALIFDVEILQVSDSAINRQMPRQ